MSTPGGSWKLLISQSSWHEMFLHAAEQKHKEAERLIHQDAKVVHLNLTYRQATLPWN